MKNFQGTVDRPNISSVANKYAFYNLPSFFSFFLDRDVYLYSLKNGKKRPQLKGFHTVFGTTLGQLRGLSEPSMCADSFNHHTFH